MRTAVIFFYLSNEGVSILENSAHLGLPIPEKLKEVLEQLHERRKQVIRLHKRGIKVMELVQMSGLSYPAVRKVLDLFEQGGWPAIKPAGRGRTKGDARLLTPEQEVHIQKTICDKRPEQLKMDFFLWSRAAVMQLIEQECGLKLGVRTVGKYLARWGFTPQKPIKKAYEQRPEAVKAWLDEHYPAIEAKAKAEGTSPKEAARSMSDQQQKRAGS